MHLPASPKTTLARWLSLLAVAAGIFGASGCDSKTDGEPAITEEPELRVDGKCVAANRFVATNGRCETVTTPTGTWQAGPLFDDGDTTHCLFRWKGGKRDVPALETSAKQAPGSSYGTALVPDCSTAAERKKTPLLVSGGLQDASAFPYDPQGGASTCEVCGLLKNDKLKLVFPSDGFRRIQIPVSGGRSQIFTVDVPKDVISVEIAAPEPPPGAEFIEGPVRIE